MSVEEKLIESLARMSFMNRTIRVVQIANPAAGADWSVTVPGGRLWRPLGITAKLVTSAVAGTRSPALKLTDQTNTLVELAPFSTQATGLTVLYSWSNGSVSGAGSSATGVITTALPDWVLPAGYVIGPTTAAIDTGDQWSQVVAWVEEVDTQPRGVHEIRQIMREVQLDSGSYAAEQGS